MLAANFFRRFVEMFFANPQNMKNIVLAAAVALAVAVVFAGCEKEKPEENFVGIEGISFENYHAWMARPLPEF